MKRFVLVLLLLCCFCPEPALSHTQAEETARTLGESIPLPDGMYVAEDGYVENGMGMLFLESGDLKEDDTGREVMYGMMAVQNDAMGDIISLLEGVWTRQDALIGLMQRNIELSDGEYTLSEDVDSYSGLAFTQMTVVREGEHGLYRVLFDGETSWLFMAVCAQPLSEAHIAGLEVFIHSALEANPMRRVMAETESVRADYALVSAVVPVDWVAVQDREEDGGGEWILQRMRQEEAVQTLVLMYMSGEAAAGFSGGAPRKDALEAALDVILAADEETADKTMTRGTRQSALGIRQTARDEEGMIYAEAWWDEDGSLMIGLLQRELTPFTETDLSQALGIFDSARKVEAF